MTNVGMQLGELVAGRPHVRGHSGYIFCWCEGFFRDGGPGWHFQKHSAVDLRVTMLLDLFRRHRNYALPALDVLPRAIANLNSESVSVMQDADSAQVGVG